MVPKSENSTTNGNLVAELDENKPFSTIPIVSIRMGPIKDESEDPTYSEGPEKNQPISHGAIPRMAVKRKAATASVNAGVEDSDPEAKSTPKKKRQTKVATKPKDSTAGRGKKSKAGAGKPKSTKPSEKSKNKLINEGRDARRECKNLKSEVKAKDEEICRLENVVTNMQNQYFSLLRKSNAGFMDDSLVKQKLFDLRQSCKDWSEMYSISGPLPDLSPSNMNALTSSLTSEKRPMSNGASFLVAGSLKYGSSIILNALLVRFICSQIIEQPFFSLRAKEIKYFMDDVSALPTSYVHDWVSQTVEMLIPSKPGDGAGVCSRLWNDILESKNEYIEESANEFINGVPAALLKCQDEGVIEERIRALRNIFQDAGDISIQLRKQRVGVRCLYIDCPNLTQNGFQRNSKLMEPHDCLCLEEGNHALDGKEIIMVIEPAIVAYWTDNDGMEKEKIWAKFVVWADGRGNVNPKDYTHTWRGLVTAGDVQSAYDSCPAGCTVAISGSCKGNGEGSKDGMTCDKVDIAEVPSTCHPDNGDELSKSGSGVIDDPMCIVDDGDSGDIVMQDTQNLESHESQGQTQKAEIYYSPRPGNSENTRKTLPSGPDHELTSNLEPTGSRDSRLSTEKTPECSNSNWSPAFPAVTPAPSTAETRSNPSLSSPTVKAESGAQDTAYGVQNASQRNLNSKKGEIATLWGKEEQTTPSVHIKVETGDTTGGDGPVNGQSAEPVTSKDSPVEVENDGEGPPTFKAEATEAISLRDVLADSSSAVNEGADHLYNEANVSWSKTNGKEQMDIFSTGTG